MNLWSDVDWRVVTASLAGELTPDEARILAGWVAEHPGRSAALARVRSAWELAGYPRGADWPVNEGWGTRPSVGAVALTAETRRDGGEILGGLPTPRANIKSTQRTRLGAWTSIRGVWALAAVMAVSAGVYFAFSTSPTALTPAQTYTTRAGQRATVRLADGTHVTLAPQTSLVVESGFGEANRRVRLIGQAYFDVQTKTARPFMVQTGRITSQVLGTQFTVRNYAKDVIVAVRSGRVRSGGQKLVTLTPNTVATITDSSTVVTADADLSEYMEWTDGRLVFSGAPAKEVMTVIGQWYGLTFQFADSSLLNRHMSGELDDHDSRQEVLQTLQLMFDARMQFHGNVVTILPKTDAAPTRARRNVLREFNTDRMEVGR